MLAGRKSYSKTDPQATCMRMKEVRGAEEAWPKPAYNVQLGTEGQFIVGYSVHDHSSDPVCLIPHLKKLKRQPKQIIADAAYGSEGNYAHLEKHKLGNYLKYTTFYQDTHRYRNPDILRKLSFRADRFEYDPQNDEFICPNRQRLSYLYTSKYKTDNGYESERCHYECKSCMDCPLKSECTKAKGNRQIQVSFKLMDYRQQARENLTSRQARPCANCAPLRWRPSLATSSAICVSDVFTCAGWKRSIPRGAWSVLPIICENWQVDARQFFCLFPFSLVPVRF